LREFAIKNTKAAFFLIATDAFSRHPNDVFGFFDLALECINTLSLDGLNAGNFAFKLNTNSVKLASGYSKAFKIIAL
jgi:hypothetical protein